MNTQISKLTVIAAVASMFAACAKTDLYDSAAVEDNQKQTYADNFVKKYGAISPAQSWDFTTGARLATRASEMSVTKVTGLDFSGTKWEQTNNASGWTISKHMSGTMGGRMQQVSYELTHGTNYALAKDMHENLPEGKAYTEGTPAVLLAPGTPFYIYPICAQSGRMHNLYVKVGDKDPQLVYQKDWNESDFPYFNGMETTKTKKHVTMSGVKIEAPMGTKVQVYMNVIGGQNGVGTASGHAKFINVTNVKAKDLAFEEKQRYSTLEQSPRFNANNKIEYIGIEENTAADSDNDYNDLVLCVIGQELPAVEVLEIEPQIDTYTYPEETTITKRYMIEDLGATDDFDFNDIVVDVIQNTTTVHTVTTTDGVITSDVAGQTTITQKAIIRHLGGTLPFTLRIGNTQLSEMQGVIGVNPDLEFEVEGWNPATNNIRCAVNQQNNTGVFNISFPRCGEAPMIIAVDASVQWMNERVSVPSTWFFTLTD